MLHTTKIKMNTADWSWFAGGSILGFIWNVQNMIAGITFASVFQYLLILGGAAATGFFTVMGKKAAEMLLPVFADYLKRKFKIKEKQKQ